MLNAILREARPAEIEAISRITNLAFAVERFFTPSDRTSPERLLELMTTGTILVADDGHGRLLGSVYVELRGYRLYIGLLAVDPAHQGRGLGRGLMEAAETFGRARGCTVSEITVVNLRTELPPFYRRLGYVESGTLPFDRAEPAAGECHFIVMSKPL